MKKAVNFLAVLGVVAMVMMGTAYAQSDLEVLDLTVSGNDVQFAGGGWGADSKPMVDFNQGGSRIYDDMHLRIETDDYLYLSPGTAVYSRTIIPQVNAAYDLGETQTRWKDLYLSGTVNAYGLVVSGPVKIGDGFLAADVDELNILDGVTASTAELNLMDGVTATTAELNYVDGVTSAIQTQLGAKLGLAGGTMTGAVNLAGASTVATGGTLNIVDAGGLRYAGTAVTSTAAELNILDGVTATATELNLIDGVTATTAELNILDGVTSTAAELNILDGVTATATELNLIDGVTATTAELNIMDGVTSTAVELNLLDGVTATTAELNYVDGVTSAIQTQLGAKLGLAGGTMTGNIVMGDNSVTGVDTITFTDVNGTVAGIENQNLVDKSATETVAGDWTFTGTVTGGFADSSLTGVDSTTLTLDADSTGVVDADVGINFEDDGVADAHTLLWDDGSAYFSFSDNLSVTGTLAVSGTSTLTGAAYADGGLDRSSAAGLTIGGTNATSVTVAPNAIFNGTISVTGTSALTGAVTTTGALTVNGSTTLNNGLTVGSDGVGHVVTFNSDTAGDSIVWSDTGVALTITGTNGQTALNVADGNLVVADTLDSNGGADFSAGLTNSGGELLVSGGNMQVNDDLVLSFGTGDDITIQYDANGNSDLQITGAVGFDGAVDMASTLGVTGVSTLAGNVDATAGLDVSGGALTVANQAITQTTGGQVTFAGNVDAAAGLDVTTAALTSAAGTTHSGGELLVSGGNMQINDDLVLTFGTDNDVSLNYDEDGNNDLQIIGAVGFDGAVDMASTLGVTGVSTLAGNVDATAGLDVSGGALTVANQAITQTTGGQVTFAGNVDAAAGVDVAGAALTTAVGSTNTAGEVLISGGNMQVNDDLVLSFGTGDDITIQYDANGNSDLQITGVVGFDGAVDMASTLGVTGVSTLAGNVDATAGLDVSGGALTVANQAITQTTGGQVTFAGNVDAAAGVDVAGAALTTAVGSTNTAGEVLISGGNMQVNDDLVLSFGTGDDITIQYDANGNSDLQITGAVGFDGAVDMASTLAVAGVATFTGNVDLGDANTDTVTFTADVDSTILPSAGTENLGADASRWSTVFAGTLNYATAITDDNAGATTVTLGDDSAADAVTITANTAITDAQWSVSNAGAAVFVSTTASNGTTHSGGELLVSGGNMQVNDDLVLSFGTGDDITIQYDANGNSDLQITGVVGFDGAVDMASTLGVAGVSTLAGNVDATAGLDVTTAALTAAAGITNSGGEVLVSGGNMQINDDLILTFGTNDDVSLTYDEDGNDDLQITGAVGFDGAVDMASTLGVTGVSTLAGNVDATAGLDVSGGALTVANQAITQTTGGQVTFAGNVDAAAGLDVTTAALTSAAGTTHSGGELLVSGGNMQINDDLVLTFGTDNDVSLNYDEDGNNDLQIIGAVGFDGAVDMASTLTVAGVSTLNGNLDLVANTAYIQDIDADSAGDVALAIDAAGTGTVTIGGASTGNVIIGGGSDLILFGASANATLSSNGAYDLVLETNSGTNSGTITITDAANGDITIAPNGTGDVVLGAEAVFTPGSQNLAGDAALTPTSTVMEVTSDTGPFDVTDITAGADGQLLIIINADGVDTIDILEQNNITSAGAFASAQYDTMMFVYESTATQWIELARSNN